MGVGSHAFWGVLPPAERVPTAVARGVVGVLRGDACVVGGYRQAPRVERLALECVAGRLAWRCGSGRVCLPRNRVRSALEPVFDCPRGVV